MRILSRIVASTAVLLAVTACSSSGSGNGSGNASGDTIETPAVTQEFNDDDVMFAQMMIPHHEQAIELSDMALDPTVGAGEEVRALATQIKGAQDPEIITMKNLLSTWGESTEMDSSMDHGDMMSGMLTAEDLAGLSALRGAEFDRAWIEAMIAHHEGAIEMALDVALKGKNQAVKSLAEAIVTGQEAEIQQMEQLLGR